MKKHCVRGNLRSQYKQLKRVFNRGSQLQHAKQLKNILQFYYSVHFICSHLQVQFASLLYGLFVCCTLIMPIPNARRGSSAVGK